MSSRYYQTLQQLWRYGIFASVGLAIDYGTLIFLKQILGLNYLIAVSAGFIAGLIFTYVLSNRYVFGAPKANNRVIFTFFAIIGLGGLVILNILVWLLTEKFGLNYIISKTLATIIVFLWNFFARRTLYEAGPNIS